MLVRYLCSKGIFFVAVKIHGECHNGEVNLVTLTFMDIARSKTMASVGNLNNM